MESLCEAVTDVLNRGAGLCLLAGHNSIGAGREIEKFADLTGASLITTPRGKSAINPYHPRACGCVRHGRTPFGP